MVAAGVPAKKGAFGAAFVLGVQAQSQLREIYGPDGAQSLSSVCRTKLILAAADADTAHGYADFLGRQERSQSNENVSFGANTIRDGVMVARQDKIEHLVIPEEIMNLKSLEGYLKMPEGFPLAKVTVPLALHEEVAPAFTPRGDQSLLITRSPAAAAGVQAEIAPKTGPIAGKRRGPAEDGQRDIFENGLSPFDASSKDELDAFLDGEGKPKGPVGAGATSRTKPRATARSKDRTAANAAFPDWNMEP